jgi:hypothetical protein
VYLRLQELGKASGILLLPPGAMEKLVAARQQSQQVDTVAYVPADTQKATGRRYLLIGLAVAAGLGLVAAGVLILLNRVGMLAR